MRSSNSICEVCGKPNNGKARKYCSRNCFFKSRLTGEEIVCVQCGDVFYISRSRMKYGRKHCSKECQYEGSKTGKHISCPICNKDFYVSGCELGRRKYCSLACKTMGDRTGHKDSKGYIRYRFANHPLASASGFVQGHWLIMYANDPKFTVQARKDGWTIHHKNGIRDDNRLENLEWRAPGQHPKGWTVDEMVVMLRQIGYEVRPPREQNSADIQAILEAHGI